MAPRISDFHGYTIVTSLSHGLMGPLKTRLQPHVEFSRNENIFMGQGEVIGGFPSPEKTLLVPGCMREAIFDDSLSPDDREYRKIFGDRIMTEVQAYIRKIPSAQVSFREKEEVEDAAGDILSRIIEVAQRVGIAVDERERAELKKVMVPPSRKE